MLPSSAINSFLMISILYNYTCFCVNRKLASFNLNTSALFPVEKNGTKFELKSLLLSTVISPDSLETLKVKLAKCV